MSNFLNIEFPKFSMLLNPLALLSATPTAVIVAPAVEIQSVAYILGVLFIADLITGLCASYFVWKEKTPKGKWFFRANEENIPEEQKGFSSDKFKKCWFKGIIYGLFPLVVFEFQETFFIKALKLETITDSEINITVICLLIFCANELFSIFWENLPKCGVNVPKGIRDLILGVRKLTDKED